MLQNTLWKLDTPPDTQVRVAEDVLALRSPLVRVHRDDEGSWSFQGPGTEMDEKNVTSLRSVVEAWPHVAGLSYLEPEKTALWSWEQHGWTGEFECHCGSCEPPVAADLDRHTWPSDLQPNRLVSVEQLALSGQVALANIIATPGGTALLGPGDQRRTSDEMAPVATANVLRRWPHTMQALRSLREGRGMRWNPEDLNWQEYLIA